MPPSPPLFLARNEVLAAATLATVVVEAPYRSGARSTAAAARRLGRPVCVVPHAPWHGPGRGCLAEIALGGRLVGSPGDVIEIVRSFAPTRPARSGARRPAEPARALALRRNASQKEAAPAPDRARAGDRPRTKGGPETVRDAAEQMPIGSEREPPGAAEGAPAVLAALGEECLHIDQICEITGLPFAMVSAALLTLTLDAVVVEGPAGSFRRAHRSGRHARAGADRVRRSGESAGFKDR